MQICKYALKVVSRTMVLGLLLFGLVSLTGCEADPPNTSNNVEKIGTINDFTNIYKFTDEETNKKYIICIDESEGEIEIIESKEGK